MSIDIQEEPDFKRQFILYHEMRTLFSNEKVIGNFE